VPRNGFIQPAQNKTTFRSSKRMPLHGRSSIDLIAEVFNAFNRTNFHLVTTESAATSGSCGRYRVRTERTAQLGFRLSF